MTVSFFYFFLLPFDVEGVQPEDYEGEKAGDDEPSEGEEEKSDDDERASINQDDEQPEDNDDANGKKAMCLILRDLLYREGGDQNDPLPLSCFFSE